MTTVTVKSRNPVAIVLAGGLGTRLRDAVPDLPKPMAPIGGRPFLEHQLDYWIDQGIRDFVLSVGYKRDAIIRHFGSAYRGIPIRYAIEESPLGTGGGLLLAASCLEIVTPILVLNGDTFFEVPLDEMLAFHRLRRSDWTFALFRTEETGRYMGMRVADDGRIESLRPSGADRPGRLANGGVYLVEPAILQNCAYKAGDKASLEDDILSGLMDSGGRLYGFECSGRFIDIGIPEDYCRAGEVLAS